MSCYYLTSVLQEAIKIRFFFLIGVAQFVMSSALNGYRSDCVILYSDIPPCSTAPYLYSLFGIKYGDLFNIIQIKLSNL